MSGNPLVVGAVDTSTATSGAGVVDDLAGLNEALASGSWLAIGLSGVGTALDAVATASDPLGSLIAAGLGWLMDHLQPLKGWLNDLTGDAGAVLGFACTWENVAKAMGNAGDELTRVARVDLERMSGASIAAYGAYADKLAEHIRAGGGSAASMASALRVCAQVVAAVHDLVRDTLAQLVGSIVSWAAEAVFSFGLATPWIVEQVSTRVSSLAARIGTKVKEVVESAAALRKLLAALKHMLARVRPALRRGAHTEEVGVVDAERWATTGAVRRRPRTSDYEANERWAQDAYDELRHDTSAADSIAAHEPGFTPGQVQQALDHLLDGEHLIRDHDTGELVRRRFDPEPNQADALLRLRDGCATDTDRLLLQHEFEESEYMRHHPGATYEQAHAHANGVADWYSAFVRAQGV